MLTTEHGIIYATCQLGSDLQLGNVKDGAIMAAFVKSARRQAMPSGFH